MSLLNMGKDSLDDEVSHLETFEEVAVQIDGVCFRMNGEFNSRQAFAVLVILLERIENLEKRLEANGIFL